MCTFAASSDACSFVGSCVDIAQDLFLFDFNGSRCCKLFNGLFVQKGWLNDLWHCNAIGTSGNGAMGLGMRGLTGSFVANDEATRILSN